jgi:hypothetical protein
MDIGKPIRRFVAVPEDEPIVAPEPAQKPVPERTPAVPFREKEPV